MIYDVLCIIYDKSILLSKIVLRKHTFYSRPRRKLPRYAIVYYSTLVYYSIHTIVQRIL